VLPIVVVATLLLLAGTFAAVSSRTISAARHHDELGRHRFLAACNRYRLPAELLVHTFEALNRRGGAPNVALGPATVLATDLCLTRLDVEDLALLVAARCDGRIPTARDLDLLDAEVRTVEDLLLFLHPFVAVPVAA
jgi:hypothetical protein